MNLKKLFNGGRKRMSLRNLKKKVETERTRYRNMLESTKEKVSKMPSHNTETLAAKVEVSNDCVPILSFTDKTNGHGQKISIEAARELKEYLNEVL